jgi:PKD domain
MALSLCLGASPAGAVISGGFGFQRRSAPTIKNLPLQYHGGPVLHSSDSYALYWDPTGTYRGDWKRLIDGYLHNVGAASGTLDNVFALNGQYGDSTGQAVNKSTFRGAYTDTDPYPTTENGGNCVEPAAFACLTDQQIQAELQHVISSGSLPGATGPAVYYLFTPPGVTVCTDGGSAETCSDSSQLKAEPHTGICGYHSAINPGSANPVIYAVQPWVAGYAGLFIESKEPLKTSGTSPDVLACQDNTTLEEPNQLDGLNPFGNYAEGLADVIINDLSIEQSNIVVDPLLNGWYQTTTNAEQGDMCKWNFGPPPKSPPTPNEETHAASLTDSESISGGSYYLQWAFNSVGLTSGKGFECWSGDSLEPHFTAPNPVNIGDVVGFDATESDITLEANVKGLPADEPYKAPIYRWNFGDGTVVSGPNDASEFHSYKNGGAYDATLTVTDSGGNTTSFTQQITVVGTPPPATSGPGAGSAGSSATGGVGSSTKPAVPGPVATQSVLSSSLSRTLKHGLAVRYSVNQQATGHFEVLLAASIAHRLGLHPPLALGLPAGTPPQVVIAKALLVSNGAGRNTLRIQFGKITAKRLRRLHKVSLLLRLNLRNAGGGTTTVLSKLTLH